MRQWIVAAAIVCFFSPHDAFAREWGNVSGRFVFDGAVPNTKMIRVEKDAVALGVSEVPDESLVIHPDNKGIANVVIFQVYTKGSPLVEHPYYGKKATAKVELVFDKGRVKPHLLLLRTRQTMLLRATSKVAHNPNAFTQKNSPIGSGLSPQGVMPIRYQSQERGPIALKCGYHPWEHGYVLVRDSPYMAKTDSDGKFTIANLPYGTHTFKLWHERAGYLKDILIRKQEVKNGRLTVGINARTTNLGTIKVPAKLLVKGK